MHVWGLHTTVALVVLGLAWTAPAEAQETAPGEAGKPPSEEGLFGVPVHGTFAFKYRLRWGRGDRDQDLYEYLMADAGDSGKDLVTAHVFLRATEDFDGTRRSGVAYPFNDITDTYRSRINERLYYGYADLHRLGPVESIRAGRQFQYETPVSLYFDGVTAFTKEFPKLQKARLGAYGGVPVHPFESAVSGDSLLGLWLQGALWRGARARIDYTRIRDSQIFGTETNGLLAFNFWQNFDTRAQFQYQHTFLGGRNRDLLVRGSLWESKLDLRAQATFYYLIETQRLETIDLDFLTSSAQDYFPYWQWRFLVSKGIGRFVNVDAGLDWRELVEHAREAPFNHDFRRYFLTPSVNNWPVPGVGASATWELWDVRGTSNGDIATWGLDVSYKPVDALKVSAGTEYWLYKFDALFNDERERVRTYFLKARYAVNKTLRIDASFEIEDGKEDDFDTLKVGASQDF